MLGIRKTGPVDRAGGLAGCGLPPLGRDAAAWARRAWFLRPLEEGFLLRLLLRFISSSWNHKGRSSPSTVASVRGALVTECPRTMGVNSGLTNLPSPFYPRGSRGLRGRALPAATPVGPLDLDPGLKPVLGSLGDPPWAPGLQATLPEVDAGSARPLLQGIQEQQQPP